jgi:hypothetical protein
VFEDKDEEGKINNSFDTKAFNIKWSFFISIKLKPFMAHKCSIRFDFELKWVYEFSIS